MNDRIASRHVLIDYTNHAGARQQRTIVPDLGGIFFGVSQWHTKEQWLLNAFDIGKEAERTFAVADIHGWLPADSREARVERGIAKQLQNSMELNARMRKWLLKLYRHPICPIDVQRVLESIDKDEEPTWHES